MEKEIWKDIPGFEGHYQASTAGRIRSVDRVKEVQHPIGGIRYVRYPGKVLAIGVNKLGYARVNLYHASNHRVASLVAVTFLGCRKKGLEICHKDGNKLNNSVANLRYDTKSSNEKDKQAHGTDNAGEGNGRSRLTEEDIRAIRADKGKRNGAMLAKKYGTTFKYISAIKCARVWEHIV